MSSPLKIKYFYMTTIQSPTNSVWPNGLQTDSEGYVNFYPLGTNKVDISTISWPEGDKLVSPFVYQNDKLVGFVDTKALEIDNNDTTIYINYTHFDADLDSIMENTLTINAPANAAVNVKYGAVDEVLTEKIKKLIGMGKCEVKFDKNNNKVTIVLTPDTTAEQATAIEQLLERVLPQNIAAEMKWVDGLPSGYTPVEYLESTAEGRQRIDLPFYPLRYEDKVLNVGILCDSQIVFVRNWAVPMGVGRGDGTCAIYAFGHAGTDRVYIQFGLERIDVKNTSLRNARGKTRLNWLNDGTYFVETALNTFSGTLQKDPTGSKTWSVPLRLFDSGANTNIDSCVCRIWSAAVSEFDSILFKLIPALDPTGAPCMYDMVTREPFYNSGTSDFIYPTDAAPAVSADLDEKFYAKLTEHGVRRLYHVPKGYTGTKDQYAAEHGFKELVEPPMPQEGYWTNEWRETETQLICVWVETEPLAEEIETLNNEN